MHANFENVADVLRELGTDKVRGVLADLGVSSLQLDRGERGFSFAQEAPLDMRMDTTTGETAADLVNHLQERELADLIFEYGEERGARRVARAIVRKRESALITTTKGACRYGRSRAQGSGALANTSRDAHVSSFAYCSQPGTQRS